MKLSKYFWYLNEKALKETTAIINNPYHPQFLERIVGILCRCQKPKELFSIISKEFFVNNWPKIRYYWDKLDKDNDFRNWWQTIYEELTKLNFDKNITLKGSASIAFLKLGKLIYQERIKKQFSQKDLALKANIKQPEISKIEQGKKNITFSTLVKLCKVLDIKTIYLE